MFRVSSSMPSCMAVYVQHMDPICLTKSFMWVWSPICLEPNSLYETGFLPFKFWFNSGHFFRVSSFFSLRNCKYYFITGWNYIYITDMGFWKRKQHLNIYLNWKKDISDVPIRVKFGCRVCAVKNKDPQNALFKSWQEDPLGVKNIYMIHHEFFPLKFNFKFLNERSFRFTPPPHQFQ